jgi:hypothetical protein
MRRNLRGGVCKFLSNVVSRAAFFALADESMPALDPRR